jgi:hypothetical protein
VIIDALRFFGKNEAILGVATLTGIIGFILTIFVSIRTSKINKILKHNQLTSQYNKERLAFQKTFEGHRNSIIADGLHSNKLLKDILQNVEEYRAKFGEIMSLSERYSLHNFSHILRKETDKVDYNKVCNYLALLSGRLSKREDKRNG